MPKAKECIGRYWKKGSDRESINGDGREVVSVHVDGKGNIRGCSYRHAIGGQVGVECRIGPPNSMGRWPQCTGPHK